MNLHLPNQLRRRLADDSPGAMVFGSEANTHRTDAPPPDGARLAAVLVLLYPRNGQWYLPLTRRPDYLPDHAGQISLPGGALEPGETASEAAIREFHEELGAESWDIELLGRLAPLLVEVSRFYVEPWVAVASGEATMTPNPAEVAELVELPLAHLLDPAQRGCHTESHGGQTCLTPHFRAGPHRIWGATCTILDELATLLGGLEL